MPAWLRLYCLYPLSNASNPLTGQELGYIWSGCYEDKTPCKLTVYGSKTSADPDSGELGTFREIGSKRDATTASDRWSFLTSSTTAAAKTVEELAQKDPVTWMLFSPRLTRPIAI